MNTRLKRGIVACISIVAVGTSGCTLSLLQGPTLGTPAAHPTPPVVATPTESPKAETVFTVTIPQPLAAGETLALAWLDEVTGLALNPQLYPMEALDPLTYKATLALPYEAVIKYRYVRLGAAQVVETSAANEGIRYRLYVASGPAEAHDFIAGWSDAAYSGPTGAIQGRVLNTDTGAPIPNMLVTAAGARAFSDSAGRFELTDIMPGTHNLVAYAIDGTFGSFQQGATVATGLNTLVEIRVHPAPLVNVTFAVSAPNDVQGAPIRIAGNLLELGNTFADLEGGVSTVADRMPVMSLQPDGRYTATISLPAGAYVRYKYTLGDGYWNAERSSDGSFRIRDLIVPGHDAEIQDQVSSWSTGAAAPILFEVTVSRDTPAEDLIYVQFNSEYTT
ncbi:MAG: carboxypeptidase regulatory-like domain-containing protein [Anaerolineales bacterium]